MKINKFLFLITLACSLFIVSNVCALTTYRTANQYGLNLREKASASSKLLINAKDNDMVLIESKTLTKNDDCKNGWYKAQYNGKVGYVCSTYLSSSKITAKVNTTDTVNIRNGAGTNYNIYTALRNNKTITLMSTTKYKGSGCDNGWYKISYNGAPRYICSDFVTKQNQNSSVIITSKAGANIYYDKALNTKKDTIKYMEPATRYDTQVYKSSKCPAGLYKILYKGYYRYICSSSLLTTNQYGITSDYVNMRSGAGTKYSLITEIYKNTNVALYNTTKYKDEGGCKDGWYKIKLDGKTGYICSTYVDLTKAKLTSSASTTTTNTSTTSTSTSGKKITSTKTNNGYYYTINKWTYRLNEDYAYARSSASTSSTLKDILYLGTELEYLGSVKATSDCSAGWYKVKYYTNKIGYICKTYVDRYSAVTASNTTYCNTLKSKGFPASYCPYLTYLHNKYPNWNFKAEKTGVTFLTAVNSETKRNYTVITKLPYLFTKNLSVTAEAGGWRTASDGYVGFMIDPRNYLNEKNIFAFESLNYEENSQNIDIVKAIVKGTYLANDPYPGYFIKAGKTHKISPANLAARVKQEGGSNKSYAAVSGTVSTKWRVTSSSFVCGASKYGEKSGSYFKLKSGSVLNVRSGANTTFSILKYSNGKNMAATSKDTLTLVKSYKYNAYTKNKITVRSGASSSKSALGTLAKNTSISVIDPKTTIKGTGCADGWYKIKYGENPGYVCSTDVNTKIGCPEGWYKIKLDKSLKNIYNYYNIGAYGDNPVIRGLAAAAGYVDNLDNTPWNTREKAIVNGAYFIASGYINRGQNTLFYQKFNVGPNRYFSLADHQYMTNILAPASESLSTYRSYKNINILNKKHTFLIPVYNSMPTSITTHPVVK